VRKRTAKTKRSPVTPARVPFASSTARLIGVTVICAKVSLVPVIFDPSLDMPFVVSKAAVSHALACVLIAVLITMLLLHGRAMFKWSPLYIPVGAFVGVNVLSALVAVDTTIATYGTHARMLGLVSTLDFAALFVGLIVLVTTRALAVIVGSSLVVASLPVLVYEVIQMSGRDPVSWSTSSVDRPFSTLGQATALAQYLSVLALGMVTVALRVAWLLPWQRIICFSYAGLLLAGAVGTGTRSALLGLVAGAGFLGIVTWLSLRGRRARGVFAAVSLGVAVAAVGGVLLTPLGARLLSTVEQQPTQTDDAATVLEPSAAGRLVLYGIAVDMVRERPALGYGPDSFMVGVPRYRPMAAPIPFRDGVPSSAHSWVAHVATSSGLIGLACFIAIALVAVVLTLRNLSSSPAVIGSVMLAGFLGTGLTTVNELGTEWLFWLSTGSIAAGTLQAHAVERGSAIRHRRDNPSRALQLASAALIGSAVLLAVAATSAWGASRAAHASTESRLAGRRADAVDSALRSTNLDPARADYWRTLGLAFASVNQWTEATNAFDRASSAAPYDPRYLRDLANAHLALASTGQSASRNRARELGDLVVHVDPNSPRASLTRAVVRQFLGEYPQALDSVEQALVLDPNSVNRELYIVAAQVMILSGRPVDAIDVSRRGLLVFGPTRTSVAIRVELARALIAAARPRDALEVLDIALVIEPSNATAETLRQSVRGGLSN
jgi:O-antigen ligase/tetratricopeptide (TPR) repeat protein